MTDREKVQLLSDALYNGVSDTYLTKVRLRARTAATGAFMRQPDYIICQDGSWYAGWTTMEGGTE